MYVTYDANTMHSFLLLFPVFGLKPEEPFQFPYITYVPACIIKYLNSHLNEKHSMFYVNVMVIAAKILYKFKLLLSQKRSIDDFGLEGP